MVDCLDSRYLGPVDVASDIDATGMVEWAAVRIANQLRKLDELWVSRNIE